MSEESGVPASKSRRSLLKLNGALNLLNTTRKRKVLFYVCIQGFFYLNSKYFDCTFSLSFVWVLGGVLGGGGLLWFGVFVCLFFFPFCLFLKQDTTTLQNFC